MFFGHFIPGIFAPSKVGLLMDEKNRYLFAEPGMHNIASCFTKVDRKPENLRSVVVHGNRTIVVVEQGAQEAVNLMSLLVHLVAWTLASNSCRVGCIYY